ncbi:MAG: hypothetical protein BWY23_02637 [Spirochaetes bacterium ADurb.Bin218]|nr:MAG: hypothetical protein BWY23_02637 [Spirochaetes bacterium ADurb.Bin218]
MDTRELKEVLQLLFRNMKSKSIIESYNSFVFDKNRIIVFNDNYSLEVPLSQFGIILYAIYKEG